ncbi:MAG: M28 family peptidase [Thermoanaerobaculia bacterium]|nr:M28 family peptidase [Thermoanaerobaculia bacterium]
MRASIAAIAPLFTLLLACQPVPETEEVDLLAAGHEAMQVIDEESLREPIAELSADEYAGRAPSTEGDEMTMAYLASQLAALGLEPGGPDGSWRQPFDIVGITTEAPDEWTFLGGRSGLNLAFYDEAIPFSGTQEATASLDSAEVVFVGYGIQAPEYDWDDYAGMDMTGKVLLMMNNDPDWDEELFAGERRLWYGRWDYKYEIAAEVGAAGAIIIHTTPSAGYPFNVVQSGWTGEQFELPTQGEPRVEVKGWVTEDAARRLVALGGFDLDQLVEAARSRDFEPVPLDVITSIELDNTIRKAETANVLGLVPGSDEHLADEVVVYTAHHDHLGVGEPDEDGDAIYNGARDNASGTAQLLAIAEAYMQLPETPRRSILFLFAAAEEQGLLGSEFYARNPTFPPGKIAANVNLDSANIWGQAEDLTFIGYGKSSLDTVVEKYAAEQGREVRGDQHPDKGYFYRSDQFNFAKIGVPALYISTPTEFVGRPEGWGEEKISEYVEQHYHQPSDELTDDWSFAGMIEDAQLAFLVGLEVAETPEMPRWNPGDEFEAARLEALAAVEDDAAAAASSSAQSEQ